MVQIEKSLQNYVNFTLCQELSWAFKTLKPMNKSIQIVEKHINSW